MLRVISSLVSIGLAVVASSYTSPVVNGRAMAQTLSQTSPGSYQVAVKLSSPRPTEIGYKVRVVDTEIVTECRGKKSSSALIKYDGFNLRCRFLQS